jgi:tripartite tricarboxylate transporter TctB family protein
MSNLNDPLRAGDAAGGALLRAINAGHGGMCVAAVLAVTGLILTWQAALSDFGDFALPGPGFFPLVLAVLVFALAVVIGVRDWRLAASQETVALGHRDVLIVFAASLAVPLLFEPLGAYVALGLFGAALLVLIARCSLLIAGLSAAIGMAACWFFFEVLLGLRLPTGPF